MPLGASPRVSDRWSMFRVAVLAVVVTVATLPAYFRIKMGYGDLLFLESFWNDILLHGGNWFSWALTPSPAYLDIFLYLASYILSPYAMDRIFLCTLLQCFVLFAILRWLVFAILEGIHSNASLAILLAIGVASLTSSTSRMWMFFNSTNNHFNALALSLLGLSYSARFLARIEARDLRRLLLISAIGPLCGQMFIVWFTAPTLLTALALAGAAKARLIPTDRAKSQVMALGKLAGAGALGLVVARSLEKWVTPWDSLFVVNRANFSTGHIAPAVGTLLRSLEDVIKSGHWGFYLISAGFVAGLIATFLALLRLGLNSYANAWAEDSLPSAGARPTSLAPSVITDRSQNAMHIYIVAFTVLSLLITPPIVFMSGEFNGTDRLRYFAVPIALPMVVLLCAAARWSVSFSRPRAGWVLVGLGVALGVYVLLAFDGLKARKLTMSQVRSHEGVREMALARCLDDHRERLGLKFGIADFWNARSSMLLTKSGMRVYPFLGRPIRPYLYMANVDWFVGVEGHRFSQPVYNFAILGGSVKGEELESRFGRPRHVVECAGNPVWVYDETSGFDDSLKLASVEALDAFNLQMKHKSKMNFSSALLQTVVGQRDEDGDIYARGGRTEPGLLVYGPYLRLPPGRYGVAIHYRLSGQPLGTHVADWDVFSIPGHVFAKGQLIADGKSEIQVRTSFVVPRSGPSLIEIRTHYLGRGDLVLDKIILASL